MNENCFLTRRKNEGKQMSKKETKTIIGTRSKSTRNEEENICKILFGEKYKKKIYVWTNPNCKRGTEEMENNEELYRKMTT